MVCIGGEATPTIHPMQCSFREIEHVGVKRNGALDRVRHNQFGVLKYMSTMQTERPEKVILTGAGAVIPALVDTLQQDLGIAVEVFNPFANVKISDKLNAEQVGQVAPLLAIAAGLASRGMSRWHM